MSESFAPLDLLRLAVGEGEKASVLFYAEIVLRTTVMFAYTVLLARLVGNGSVGQVGPFELVLVIAIGSAAGDPMFSPDVPLAHGLLVITVAILLHRLLQWLVARGGWLARYLEGTPKLLVEHGRVLRESLGRGTLTYGELMAMLRARGVSNVGEVEKAWFETTGELSIFRFPPGTEREGQSTLP